MLPYFQRTKKITKVGVVVDDLRPSTMNYSLIDLGNKIANERSDIDFYVFNEGWKRPPTSICFPLLQQRHIWGFDGILIATNINTAIKLINLPNVAQKKFFYVWNLIEWTNTLTNSKEILELYRANNIKIITRSSDYAFVLQNNFNVEPLILEDFNYEKSITLFKTYTRGEGKLSK